jgi:uncharacterized membrane protein YdjX (TVP38/TMEM64 family)
MPATQAAASPMKSSVTAIVGGLVIVGLILAVLVYFDVHLKLIALLEWIDRQGAVAAFLFIGVMALAVVLVLPGIFLTTGAGYVFGIAQGTLYVVLGTTLGAAAAFLVARHLFGTRARRYIMGKSKLSLVNAEMAKNDFKVVLLTRLIPFFPGKLSNYFFGLTDFRFTNYVAASLIGYIPFSLHNVYVGSLVSDLAQVSEGGMTRSPLQWAMYGMGFIFTVIAVIYFNSIAKRALSGYTAGNDRGGS